MFPFLYLIISGLVYFFNIHGLHVSWFFYESIAIFVVIIVVSLIDIRIRQRRDSEPISFFRRVSNKTDKTDKPVKHSPDRIIKKAGETSQQSQTVGKIVPKTHDQYKKSDETIVVANTGKLNVQINKEVTVALQADLSAIQSQSQGSQNQNIDSLDLSFIIKQQGQKEVANIEQNNTSLFVSQDNLFKSAYIYGNNSNSIEQILVDNMSKQQPKELVINKAQEEEQIASEQQKQFSNASQKQDYNVSFCHNFDRNYFLTSDNASNSGVLQSNVKNQKT